MAKDKTTPITTGRKQTTIPGTEPKIPAGILRQAHKVLEMKDAAELAKKRADQALDFLHAAMAREKVERFVLDEPDMACPLVFHVDPGEPKLKIDGYKKPEITGDDMSKAVG